MSRNTIDVVVNRLKIRFEIPNKIISVSEDYRIGIGPILKVELHDHNPTLIQDLIKSSEGYVLYVYTP